MCSKKATSKYSQQPGKTSAGINSSNSVVGDVGCLHGLPVSGYSWIIADFSEIFFLLFSCCCFFFFFKCVCVF